ncbi:hypothetical protein AGABI1DRAFT_110322, partial [Agaricus bisporus var. burnettii JB137-S8]
MPGNSKRTCKPYYPASMDSVNAMGSAGPPRVHEAQYFRANLRMSHPPMSFLDDFILLSGLEEFEEHENEQAEQSPTMPLQPKSPCEENQRPRGVAVDGDVSDGVISPLELPPRLVNFAAADETEATLSEFDLKEVDRRLESVVRSESISRLERLLRANALDLQGFFGTSTFLGFLSLLLM